MASTAPRLEAGRPTSPADTPQETIPAESLGKLLGRYLRKSDGVGTKQDALMTLSAWADRCASKRQDWVTLLGLEVKRFVEILEPEATLRLLANLSAKDDEALQLREALIPDLCKTREAGQSAWNSSLTVLSVVKWKVAVTLDVGGKSAVAWGLFITGIEFAQLCRHAQTLRAYCLRTLGEYFDAELASRIRAQLPDKTLAQLAQRAPRERMVWQQMISDAGLSSKALRQHGLPEKEDLEALCWEATVYAFSRAWTLSLKSLCEASAAELPARLEKIYANFMQVASDMSAGWEEWFGVSPELGMNPVMARQLCLEGFLEQILSSLDLGEGSEQERAWLDSAEQRLKALKTMPEACEMLQWVALRSKHVSQGVPSSDS